MSNSESNHYLISPAQDYTFIAGSAIIGYAVLALMAFGVVSIAPFSMFLLLILEAPHIFGTWTRSYLDPEHREKLGKRVLWQIVPLCLAPPLFILAGAQVVFYVLTVCWLHSHVAKQHVGFLALYKRKAGEFDDMWFETKFYKIMLYVPVIFFLLHKRIGLEGYMIAGAVALVPMLWFTLRQYENKRLSLSPKLVLMATTIPLQWLAFGFAITHPNGAKAAGVVLAFSHTIQYHRLNVLYHKEDAKTAQTRKLWHSFAGYAVVAIVLNFALYLIPGALINNELALSMFWGMIFQHYLLDAKIWKTKDFPIFAKSLKLA